MSFALGFLKPDCLRRGLEETVYDIIESGGLKIVFRKRLHLDVSNAQNLYYEWRGMDFYHGLCQFISSGEIEVFIAEGHDAIRHLQQMVGGHDLTLAPLSIRGRFATSIRENVIHSTSNENTFARESALLLGEDAERWINSNVGTIIN